MSGLNLGTTGGILELLGLVVILIGVILVLAALAPGLRSLVKPAAITALIGLLILGGGFIVVAVTPTTSPPAPAPTATQTVNALQSPGVNVAGETWNSVSNTLTVDVVYNYTSNYFAVQAANGSTYHNPNYIFFPIKLIRTDNSNTTAAFPLNVASVPTAQSLGTSPSTYSIVGFKAATSSVPGQWQIKWTQGTTGGTFSSVNAPTVSTNVAPDSLPVSAFGSASSALQVSLAGGNGTVAPSTFYQALTTYGTYSMIVSIGNSTPATMTISFIVLGEHA